MIKKVLFTATVDSHILNFHTPYLKYFKERGYEVHVATNGTKKIPYCDVKHTVSFERSPLKFNNLKAIHRLKTIIDTEKFEIIHTHTPMGGVVTRLAAIRSRKQLNTRVIYTAHGFHFFKGAPVTNWLLFYPIEKILAHKTDTLITINKEDYQLAKKKFKTDVQYVPGVGLDKEKFNFNMTQLAKTKLRKSLGLKDSDFVLIYPAELSKRKRQVWLVDTLKELILTNPDIHLLLPGKDSLGGKLHKYVNMLTLNDNIHLLGFRKDIPKLLSIADVAVSAARQEGLPINILEAMFSGLPVIASAGRGNSDLCDESIFNHAIETIDMDGYTDKILEYFNERKRLSRAGSHIKPYLLTSVLKKMDMIYLPDTERISCLFVHDFKFTRYHADAYGDGQFKYENLWQPKYLTLFSEMTILARGHKSNSKKDIVGKYKINGSGVKVIASDDSSSFKRLIKIKEVRRNLYRLSGESDIGIVRLPSIQGLIACSVFNKVGKPYVLEIVGSSFESLWHHDKLKGKLVAPIAELLTRYYIRKANNVTYVTHEYLQRKYPCNYNTMSCSDVLIQEIDTKVLTARLAKIDTYNDNTVYKIGLVGSYDVLYKGHLDAIRALSKLEDRFKYRLVFLGSGSRDRWTRLAKAHSVYDNIVFQSPVTPGAEMNAWLDSMDIVIIPSKTEGMPRVLLENMSRAGISIAARVGDIPYMLPSEQTVEKGDWKNLSTTLKNTLSSKELMKQIAKRDFKKSEAYTLKSLDAKRNEYFSQILMGMKRGRQP